MRRLTATALLWVAVLSLYPPGLVGRDCPQQINQRVQTGTSAEVIQHSGKPADLPFTGKTNSCSRQPTIQILQRPFAKHNPRIVLDQRISDSKQDNTRFCGRTLSGSRYGYGISVLCLKQNSVHQQKELRLEY